MTSSKRHFNEEVQPFSGVIFDVELDPPVKGVSTNPGDKLVTFRLGNALAWTKVKAHKEALDSP